MDTLNSQDINTFLKRFHISDNIDTVFTEGCCYWFALILHTRFPNSKIMYDPVVGHFVTNIDNQLYDITGNVTNKYTHCILWDFYYDDLEKERIIKQCINF